jgi:exodeoxyribonuclease-5
MNDNGLDQYLEDAPKVEQGRLASEDKIEEARSTLNEGQLKAFNGLLDFLNSDKKYSVVIGYAGTGKTYMLGKLLSVCEGKKAATAPTNKAVKVLRENGGFGDVTYATIHQLLALKIQWRYPPKGSKEEPKQILVRNRYSAPTIQEYDILIVDEVSMLSDELFEMLNSSRYDRVKIIFSGDPAQIPPVGFEDSIPLVPEQREGYDIQMFELDQIMRQKEDSQIVQCAYWLRTHRYRPTDPLVAVRQSKFDIAFYSSNWAEDKIEFTTEMLNMFKSKEFKDNPNHCKVLAWTNKTVDGFNRLIRRHIFDTPDLKYIMKGEKMIADKPIMENEDIIFTTSDEFTILDYKVRTETLEKAKSKSKQEKEKQTNLDLEGMDIQQGNTVEINYYDCIVEYQTYDTNEAFRKNIKVLSEESEKAYKWLCHSYKVAEDWKGYTEMLERFAKVKYNYAITCHKAQGSTYGTVFLIEDDIDKNYKHLERNRIKYTAFTRPRTKLMILSHKNKRHTEDFIW